jgi:mannitol operon repressor
MKKNPFKEAPEEIKRIASFLNIFYKETDRGAALMAGSVIDEILKEIILKFLIDIKESGQLMNGFNAPIGTFSSRILMAYTLGLIEDTEYFEIETIRKIRNLFGHSWTEADFFTPKIKSQIEKFPFQEQTFRLTFNHTVANLLGELIWRSHYVSKERRALKKWPNKNGFLKR